MRQRGKGAAAESGRDGQSEAVPAELPTQRALGACFRVAPAEGRGLGAFASCGLPCGQLLLGEHPVLAFCSEDGDATEKRFQALPIETRDKVMSLHDESEGAHSLDGVLFTNALPRGSSHMHFILCLEASRFNHSCKPNCDYCWDDRTNEVRIYASADIEEGCELTIGYMDVRDAERERRGNLKRRYGFQCNCEVCSHDTPDSDRRRLRMKAINLELDTPAGPKKTEPLAGLKLVEELLDLYNAEGLQLKSYGKKACYYGYQFALLRGELEQAKWWIGRAYAYSVYCHGEHHEQTERLLAYLEEPEAHPANKTAMRSGFFKVLGFVVITLITVKLTMNFISHVSENLGAPEDPDAIPPNGLPGQQWLTDLVGR